jgi:hypothetical protein
MHPLEHVDNSNRNPSRSWIKNHTISIRLLFLLDYNIMTLLIKQLIILLSSIFTSVNDSQTTPETRSFVAKRSKRITSAI